MRGPRGIRLIALGVTALMLLQGAAAASCMDLRPDVARAHEADGHHSHQDAHGPAPSDAESPCPMAGAASATCGASALASETTGSLSGSVTSAVRVTFSIVVPPSLVGTDLFHPPRVTHRGE